MPNKSYQRGRAKEYRLKKAYEKAGYICLRTAGSHGFADLIVIDSLSRMIRFIQCKPKKFSPRKRQRLMSEYSWLHLTNWQTEFDVI